MELIDLEHYQDSSKSQGYLEVINNKTRWIFASDGVVSIGIPTEKECQVDNRHTSAIKVLGACLERECDAYNLDLDIQKFLCWIYQDNPNHNPCVTCQGTHMIMCSDCNGDILCAYCDGTGVCYRYDEDDDNEIAEKCYDCEGRGECICEDGITACPDCDKQIGYCFGNYFDLKQLRRLSLMSFWYVKISNGQCNDPVMFYGCHNNKTIVAIVLPINVPDKCKLNIRKYE